MKIDVSILIQTHNEEDMIKDCIDSARLVSEDILVVDTESSDNTVSIAKEKDVRVLSFPYSYYVEPARQFGMEKSQGGWVLILDADERVTEKLREEISEVIKQKEYTHFKIPRKNMFAKKKWLKHGGWWPDYQIRLIKKSAFTTWPEEIHSTPRIEGKMAYLTSPLLHYFHGDLEKMVEKTVIFENVEAQLLFEAKKSVSSFTFFRKFIGELYRRLFKHAGFLDGNVGIIEGLYQAFSKTITYLYLYEKKKSSSV